MGNISVSLPDGKRGTEDQFGFVKKNGINLTVECQRLVGEMMSRDPEVLRTRIERKRAEAVDLEGVLKEVLAEHRRREAERAPILAVIFKPYSRYFSTYRQNPAKGARLARNWLEGSKGDLARLNMTVDQFEEWAEEEMAERRRRRTGGGKKPTK